MKWISLFVRKMGLLILSLLMTAGGAGLVYVSFFHLPLTSRSETGSVYASPLIALPIIGMLAFFGGLALLIFSILARSQELGIYPRLGLALKVGAIEVAVIKVDRPSAPGVDQPSAATPNEVYYRGRLSGPTLARLRNL